MGETVILVTSACLKDLMRIPLPWDAYLQKTSHLKDKCVSQLT